MELQLKPIGRHSTVSGQAFEPGQKAISWLFLGADGGLLRADALEAEEPAVQIDGTLLCKWRRIVREPGENATARRQALLTAEDLFLALHPGEPGDGDEVETMGPEMAGDSETTAALKHLLALMLERKRILKPLAGQPDRYLHPRSRRVFTVEPVDLTAGIVIRLEERLAFLL